MLLQVDSLFAGYGRIQVLRSIAIEVGQGERVGLFGPNGHGKTTLLRTISGLVKATGGRITFDGRNITNLAPDDIVSLGLIHVPQGSTLFPRMSVLENLTLGAYSSRAWPHRAKNLERVYELFPILKERSNQLAPTLSPGPPPLAPHRTALLS